MTGIRHTSVSIVLPLYNPPERWYEQFQKNIKEWNDYLSPAEKVEYIVVYDGDPVWEVKEQFKWIVDNYKEVRFLTYKINKGKGHALRHGVRHAVADTILTVDFDFPYQKESAGEMIKLLREGNDVIIGKRSKEYFTQIPFKRKVISKVFSSVATFFLGLPLKDTQSGMKGFNKKGKEVFLETTINRFLVDTEFVLRAWKKDLLMKIIEIQPKPYLSFTNFGMKVIKTESRNFLKLLYLKRVLQKKQRA